MRINISYKCSACLNTVDALKRPPIFDHAGNVVHCGCKSKP